MPLQHVTFYSLQTMLPVQKSRQQASSVDIYLKMETPPLWMSTARKEVGGNARAVHRNARIIDLCVTTRWLVPGASKISAGAMKVA